MDLVVFDLDGTLLNNRSQISVFTRETLLLLTQNNIAYTVATGRTQYSARNIIDGHGFVLPHIYSNGVITWHPAANTVCLENGLSMSEVTRILDSSFTQNITPFISTVDKNHQHTIYHPPIQHEAEQQLLDDFYARIDDITIRDFASIPHDVEITNISMIGDINEIDAIQHGINTETHLIAYSGPAIEGRGLKWMDIHHKDASKGNALESLRESLKVSNMICFGDSDNDLSMFAVADESYAMENAKTDVKAHATDIIGHHNEDGVAHFLRERFSL